MPASTAIVPVPASGAELYRASTDAASLCKAIVVATARNIQGRKYVQVEGWQAIAIAHGCVASSGEVERVNDPACPGFKAIGKVIKVDTGQVIAQAEGFVGDDESTWSTRPIYARRAMAQTRAISRACRSGFAHVVVMMNAGLQTTPAEEVPEGGFDDGETKAKAETAKEKLREQVETLERAKAVASGEAVVPFGLNKGKPIAGLAPKALKWLADALRTNLNDPAKEQYKAETARLLAATEAEIARQESEPA